VVTGAAGGIGAAIVAQLHARGARVAVVDIDADAADRVVQAIRSEGAAVNRDTPIKSFTADVSSSDSIAAATQQIEERLGPVDILVNNAGIDKIEAFVDSVEATWDRLIALSCAR